MLIQTMADMVSAQREYLCTLDSTVGDGDHGISLTMALSAAVKKITQQEHPSPQSVLTQVGTTIQNGMGGASGVLFGSFFLGAGDVAKGKVATTLPDLVEMLTAALAQVQKRGRAQPGDKTMVDALAPAVSALQSSNHEGASLAVALQRAADAARVGAESTRGMVARFGRAKSLGDRSLGFQDAGATSMAILLEALAKAVDQ